MTDLRIKPHPTSCAVGCGACCDPVHLGFPVEQVARWSTERIKGYTDPTTDEGWAGWVEVGWTDEQREDVVHRMSDNYDRRNADFLDAHWHELLGPEREGDYWPVGDPEKGETAPQRRVHCDAFDRHTRTCTVWGIPAEEGGQPPVCSGYPHYGMPAGVPGLAHYGIGMSPSCSFNAEVRTFLPIVEVRHP
jgi:hypothetical protein